MPSSRVRDGIRAVEGQTEVGVIARRRLEVTMFGLVAGPIAGVRSRPADLMALPA